MNWTTANIKSSNYLCNHEIYVGTQTGSFKRLNPGYEKNPFAQRNLVDLSKLDKQSRITTLAFGNEKQSEILIGRAHNTVELYSPIEGELQRHISMEAAPIVGLARYGEQLVAGFGTGQIQQISLSNGKDNNENKVLLSTGDDMSHLRQCSKQCNLVATGGKGRQNNLKVYDMEAGGKQVFSSKNVPNDFLQLEVPIWDSDVGFLDAPHTLATCSRYGYVRFYDTRKQRRPVQCFATEEEDQMSFATLAAYGNNIYSGTTKGVVKSFDIRRMKTFVHTYKGFTGGISDLHLDVTGKFLVSACLDRYVRIHHVDSCALLYQCYVKSQATRVLIRESTEEENKNHTLKTETEVQHTKNEIDEKSKRTIVEDKEYEDMFANMQTICEPNEDTVKFQNIKEDNKDASNPTVGMKRKNKATQARDKKKFA